MILWAECVIGQQVWGAKSKEVVKNEVGGLYKKYKQRPFSRRLKEDANKSTKKLLYKIISTISNIFHYTNSYKFQKRFVSFVCYKKK